MVQQAFSYIEKISNLDIKLKLIDTLRTVTAGKVSIGPYLKWQTNIYRLQQSVTSIIHCRLCYNLIISW